MLFLRGSFTTEPRSKGEWSAALACLGLDLPLVTVGFPHAPPHTQWERMEDTSVNNRDTGVQGHQSAGAKNKAVLSAPPPNLCQPKLATKP